MLLALLHTKVRPQTSVFLSLKSASPEPEIGDRKFTKKHAALAEKAAHSILVLINYVNYG